MIMDIWGVAAKYMQELKLHDNSYLASARSSLFTCSWVNETFEMSFKIQNVMMSVAFHTLDLKILRNIYTQRVRAKIIIVAI